MQRSMRLDRENKNGAAGPHPTYCHQNEYRFVWNVTYQVEEPIFIECPEAIKFCEKVT